MKRQHLIQLLSTAFLGRSAHAAADGAWIVIVADDTARLALSLLRLSLQALNNCCVCFVHMFSTHIDFCFYDPTAA